MITEGVQAMETTTQIIEGRLARLSDLSLAHGPHRSFEKGACALEVVAWLAGEEHGDHPECVCPVIGAFVRSWNDALPDDAARNRILRPILPDLVGTRIDKATEERRAWMAVDWLTRECVPAWLWLRSDLIQHAETLRSLDPVESAESARGAKSALNAARAAARAAAWDEASAAASAEASAAARDAAWAGARDAASAAASAAAWAALEPTVCALQDSAVDLLRRMIEVGTADGAAENEGTEAQ